MDTKFMLNSVAPYVGAWIETPCLLTFTLNFMVAPYVGAWIETSKTKPLRVINLSHPTWVRGLKLTRRFNRSKRIKVAPYVGAWIET